MCDVYHYIMISSGVQQTDEDSSFVHHYTTKRRLSRLYLPLVIGWAGFVCACVEAGVWAGEGGVTEVWATGRAGKGGGRLSSTPEFLLSI